MNILIVTAESGLQGGGLAKSCWQIADILRQNHSVEILMSTEYPIFTAQDSKLYKTIGIRNEFKLKTDRDAYKNTDLVIGFGGNYNGYYASLLAEHLDCRFILSLRGSDANLVKWNCRDAFYLSEAARRANKIFCLSNEMCRNVISLVPSVKNKIEIVPNIIENNFADITFPNLPEKVKIGCAATHLNEKKGIANILNMIARFKVISDIPIVVELAGLIDEDLKDQYVALIESLNLKDSVNFLGYLSRENLSTVMTTWDFYIQGSVCEGHSNSILESLYCGTAFISSATGFIWEMLAKDYPYFFFESWNPNVMAENLKNLIIIRDKENLYTSAIKKLMQVCDKNSLILKWNNLITENKMPCRPINFENILAVAFHDVFGELHDSITVSERTFEEFVKTVYENGFSLCSMRDYLKKNSAERQSQIVCTFDDGYENLVNVVLPILSEYNFTATTFICTDLIGRDNTWNNKDSVLRRHLDLNGLKKLISHGWEIASHGVTHRNLLKLSESEIRKELSCSKEFLLNLVGYSDSYAYPYGGFNNFIKFCVQKYYTYAFAVSQGGTSLVADSFQLKRYSIDEICRILDFRL